MTLNPSGVPSRAGIQAAIDEAVAAATVGRPYREAAGTALVSISSFSGFTAITFPAGRFSVAPLVTCTVSTGQSGSQKVVPRALNVTATGASLYLYTGDNTSVTVNSVGIVWRAVQMTPTAAAG